MRQGRKEIDMEDILINTTLGIVETFIFAGSAFFWLRADEGEQASWAIGFISGILFTLTTCALVLRVFG